MKSALCIKIKDWNLNPSPENFNWESYILFDFKWHLASALGFCYCLYVSLIIFLFYLGLSDHLNENKIKCFGPCQKAAQIEASKEFAKAFMDRHEIPTAKWKSFKSPEDAKQHVLR